MFAVRSTKNVLAGILFIGTGAVGLIIGRDYEIGDAFRMGAGYFPMVVGTGLVGTGLAIMLMGFTVDGEKVPRISLRPLLFVLGAVVIFALMLPPFGLVLSTVVLTVLSRLAGWDRKPAEIAILALALSGGAGLIFVYGLGLPLPLWPR